MLTVAAAAFKRYNPAKSLAPISVEELDKITMHLHCSKRISRDVASLIFETTIERLEQEKNIVSWTHLPTRRAPRTFVFANMDITYEKLYHLTSATSLQHPSPENKFIFLGSKLDKNPENLRGLLSLLTMQIMFPESVCLVRSRTLDEIKNDPDFSSNSIEKNSSYLTTIEKLLPVSVLLDDEVFITNGGISNLTSEMTIADLQNLSRSNTANSEIFDELISAVPISKSRKSQKDDKLFSANQLSSFIAKNSINLVIRNSKGTKDSFKVSNKGKCISFNGDLVEETKDSSVKPLKSIATQPMSAKFGHNMSCVALVREKDNPGIQYKLLNL